MTQAMQAVFAGKPTKLTPAQAEQIRASFSQKMQTKMAAKAAEAGQKNLREGQAFLAANKAKPGVRSTAERPAVPGDAPGRRSDAAGHRQGARATTRARCSTARPSTAPTIVASR